MRVMLDGRALPIFPVGPDKRPRCEHGLYDAQVDWPRWPAGTLPAVPTGAASGIDVLDIDPEGMSWLAQHGAALPSTRVHTTRRGNHFLFKAAPGLRSSCARIAPGVDVRATGGYALWHPAAGLPVQDAPLAEWPPRLLGRARDGLSRRVPETPICFPREMGILGKPSRRETQYAWRSLENAYFELRGCPNGRRNALLNILAYKIGRLVARGWLDRARAESILERGAAECGLIAEDGLAQVRATIASGMTAGQARPYHDICAAPLMEKVL